jgi:hypothetical protein
MIKKQKFSTKTYKKIFTRIRMHSFARAGIVLALFHQVLYIIFLNPPMITTSNALVSGSGE